METLSGAVVAQRSALAVVQAGHLAGLWRSARHFQSACRDPERIQLQLLGRILRAAIGTRFDREHGLARCGSPAAFRQRVPIRNYEGMRPWIERMTRGEENVLTSAPLLAFEPSSGTTSGTKLVPYTRELLRDYQRATAPWLFDIFFKRPSLLTRPSYWSVSSASTSARKTERGVPIGLADDTEYFGPVQRWAIRKTLAVAPEVARISDADQWRHATVLGLLEATDLGFISIWHPSFITLLLEYAENNWDTLLAELPKARRADLLARRQSADTLTSNMLWPRLRLISCWTQGPAAQFLPELRSRCPDVETQGKGLLATEGVVSIPLTGLAAPVAAVASHFLEFVDLQQPSAPPQLLHELREGADYRPLLTTGGGLFRYDLGDRVRCVGHHHRAPLLSFEGRLDHRSDICGEKLDVSEVGRTLEACCNEVEISPRFMALAPTGAQPPRYTLFVESQELSATDIRGLASRLESSLNDNHHYALCRRLGQLDAVSVVPIRDGFYRYQTERARRGMRPGDIKPTHLLTESYWERVFTEEAEAAAGCSRSVGH